jgi:hypothetical protein
MGGVPRGYSVAFSLILLSFLVSERHVHGARVRGDTSGGVVFSKVKDGMPAVDLTIHGKPIDANQATRISSKELSQLEPVSNLTWQSEPLSLEDSSIHYPKDGTEFVFDPVQSYFSSSKFLYRMNLTSKEDGQIYRVVAGYRSHNAPPLAALLRKLGYPVQTPKHFKNVVIRFPDLQTREDFIDHFTLVVGSFTRWLVTKPKDESILVMRDLVVEPSDQMFPYHWGALVRNQRRDDIRHMRSHRALVVPWYLLDIYERVNLFSWEMGRIMDESVYLPNYLYAQPFNGETTYEDSRWIARKIAKLTRRDWEEIIALGHFPKEVEELVLEKTVSRRNHMVKLFDLEDETPIPELPFKKNVNNETVKDSKLTKDKFEGCAHDFTMQDPKSPLRVPEIARFGIMQAINYGIQTGVTELNKLLTFNSIDKIAQKHQEDLFKRFLNYFFDNPGKPFVQPLQTYGGFFGGLVVNASREPVTGTYYGSDSKVQLVDSISIGGTLNFFLALEPVPLGMLPMFNPNVNVIRSYVHVRPIIGPQTDQQLLKKVLDPANNQDPDMMKAALEADWKDLILTPKFMENLGDLIDPDSIELSDSELNQSGLIRETTVYDKATKRFFDGMKEGEMFIVSDLFSLAPTLRLNIPITAILGIDPLGYINNVGFSVDYKLAGISRMTFTKTKNGVHVYRQTVDFRGPEIGMDLAFWTSIFRLGYNMKDAKGRTEAYLVEPKPTEHDKRKQWVRGLKAFFTDSNYELLDKYFPPTHLDHKLENSLFRGNFLLFHWYDLEETNRVKITPTIDPNPDEDKRVDHHGLAMDLVSYRTSELIGSDPYGLISDIINGFFPGKGPRPKAYGFNPAASPFGSAEWETSNTEMEATVGKETEPVTVFEKHWQGWYLSKKKMFKIMDEIEEQAKAADLKIQLFNREEFNAMSHVELYDIKNSLLFYPQAFEEIRKKILSKDVSVKSALAQLLYAKGIFQEFAMDERKDSDLIYSPTRQPTSERIHGRRQMANQRNAFIEFEGSRKIEIHHIDPWMVSLLKRREEKEPIIAEERVKWRNEIFKLIQKNLTLDKIVNLVGRENIYYGAAVNGFRANDENGEAPYYTGSIGTYDDRYHESMFQYVAEQTGILYNVLTLRALSESF